MSSWVMVAVVTAACTSGSEVDTSSATSTSMATGVVSTLASTTTRTSPAGVASTAVPPGEQGSGSVLTDVGLVAVDLTEGVAAANEVLVWTGDELVLWGGDTTGSGAVPTGEPGHAYDPRVDSWRTTSPSPKAATSGAAGVWTGELVVICCGAESRATAAYDPAADSWRALADAPISGLFAEAVWTGREMLVVTDAGVAAFELAADEWRVLPDPPLRLGRRNGVVWTGTEAIVWPADAYRSVHLGMALDPNTEAWRVLPPPPAWPAVADIVWTGRDLIVWGGLPAAGAADSERAVGSRLDLAADAWSALPEPLPEPDGCECNLGSQTLLWTGERLLVSTGHLGSGVDPTDPLLLAYDPADNGWSLVGESPTALREALMAGDRVVFRSDRLYLSEPGWAPVGVPLPDP